MAVLDFKMVYRDGASTGAPVTSFKLADTVVELTTGVEGDIAYAKNTDLLYLYTGTAWLVVGSIFDGGTIGNNLYVVNPNPEIGVGRSGQPKARLMPALANRADLSYNAKLPAWAHDDNSQAAQTFVINEGPTTPFSWYNRKSTDTPGNFTRLGNFDSSGNFGIIGNYFSNGRGVADGAWQNVPYGSGNFTPYPSGTWTVASGNILLNQYTQIGKTCIWSVGIQGSNLTVPASAVNALVIFVPGGMTPTAVNQATTGMLYHGASAKWEPVLVQVANTIQISIIRLDPGVYYASGQINLHFTFPFSIS